MPDRVYTLMDIFWPVMGAFLGVLNLYERLDGRPKWHKCSVILSSGGAAVLLGLAAAEFWSLGGGAAGLVAWLGGNVVSSIVDAVLAVVRDTEWIKRQLAGLIPGKDDDAPK